MTTHEFVRGGQWACAAALAAGGCCVAEGQVQPAALEPVALRCEYRADPVGIGATRPRLSWRVESGRRGERQTAFQILVASSPELLNRDTGDLWDTGRMSGDETIGTEYAGAPLVSRERCYWKVRVWSRDGQAAWSGPAEWSMGLLSPGDWKSEWIGFDEERLKLGRREGVDYLPPAPYLRTTFRADRPVLRATLYASALGLVEPHLNGHLVSEDFFTPGWTDYSKRVDYRTYDVTQWVHPGENALGAVLADGWYAGYVGFGGHRDHYGTQPRIRMQLQIDYADGSSALVGTGPDWKAATGPVREADFLKGETYDARMEFTGWDDAGFNDAGWRPVVVGSEVHPFMQAHPGPPVRVIAEFRAKTTSEPRP